MASLLWHLNLKSLTRTQACKALRLGALGGAPSLEGAWEGLGGFAAAPFAGPNLGSC